MYLFLIKNLHKITGILFIIIISVTAHLLFSSIGFVPTDDGFLLAYSKRILDGQIPYKDFLSAHNLGTPLFFAPFVYFGGEYTFWITRFIVWFEFAVIAWIWLSFLTKSYNNSIISYVYRIIIATIAFLFTAHSFPPMVWYTIDGLFFYSIGLYLTNINNNITKSIGYFLIGFIFIIKQNFIFLLPLTIIILKDWKFKRYWLLMLLPSILYYSFFLITGNIYETIAQTYSRTEFIQTAVKAYWSKFTFPWGLIIGFISLYLIHKSRLSKVISGSIILYFPILYSIYHLNRSEKFIWDVSFLLFGVVSGMILYFLWVKKGLYDIRIPFLGLACAWSVSISGGYNTPALATGILFILIIYLFTMALSNNLSRFNKVRNTFLFFIILLTPLALNNFNFTRTHNIYGESKPADQIIYKMDDLLPGGKNLLASKEVYLQMKDLQNAINIAQKIHKRYAVLSSFPAIWVKSNIKNPLLMDFPFILYGQKALVNRLQDQLRQEKGGLVLIVEKSNLNQKQEPSYGNIFQIAILVPKYYQKAGETKYFFIYK